jgi:hypothetical protein
MLRGERGLLRPISVELAIVETPKKLDIDTTRTVFIFVVSLFTSRLIRE